MTKKILLYVDNYGDKVTVNEAYVNFLNNFGEVILVMPSNNLAEFIESADVLALPGGADVDPMRYNEFPQTGTRTNPHFEYMDRNLLHPWIKTGKPIIGICRGLQTLNVAMGGSLYQDIRGHNQSEARDYGSQLLYTDIKGFNINRVNSFHHQAIKVLAPNFDVIGWTCVEQKCKSLHDKRMPDVRHVYEYKSKHDKTPERGKDRYYSFPEIIKHRTLPYIAFQYHPEEFTCTLAMKLISETLNLEYAPAEIIEGHIA